MSVFTGSVHFQLRRFFWFFLQLIDHRPQRGGNQPDGDDGKIHPPRQAGQMGGHGDGQRRQRISAKQAEMADRLNSERGMQNVQKES